MKKSMLILLFVFLLAVSTINAAENSAATGLEKTLKGIFFLLLGVLGILTLIFLKKSGNSKEYLDPRAHAYYYYPKR